MSAPSLLLSSEKRPGAPNIPHHSSPFLQLMAQRCIPPCAPPLDCIPGLAMKHLQCWEWESANSLCHAQASAVHQRLWLDAQSLCCCRCCCCYRRLLLLRNQQSSSCFPEMSCFHLRDNRRKRQRGNSEVRELAGAYEESGDGAWKETACVPASTTRLP